MAEKRESTAKRTIVKTFEYDGGGRMVKETIEETEHFVHEDAVPADGNSAEAEEPTV